MRGPHIPGAGVLLRTVLRAIHAITAITGTGGTGAVADVPIDKFDDDLFRRYRYSFFPSEYRTVKVDRGEAVYTRAMFWPLPGVPEGVQLSLLVDVNPARRAVFDAVVREIVRTDTDIDYLIYLGYLPFQPGLLWRVPRRFERPAYYLGGRLLRPDLIDDRVYRMENWNINLSHTDLV